ncbi:MAG: hypothetical protein Unbinned8261contig1001_9 [Prokaryotic dsDNA virus sp.]|nr:MAG: hypothetical protein Unbinned8261contig1001_9 [Prokaryotic dsDNA virus sp.]
MSKDSLDKRVSRDTYAFIVMFKVIWKFMLFSVLAWYFIKLLYFIKSRLGIDIIPGWSLFH